MKKIAIMQPTYLPWLGYFALMTCVNEFILLDDVQFERKSWQQQNRIKGAEGPIMLRVPVRKTGRLDTAINKIEIDWSSEFDRKHLRAVESAYGSAPYWQRHSQGIRKMISCRTGLLADYTASIIDELRGLLAIKTPLLRSSDLAVSGKRESLLVDICNARMADVYVSPPGAQSYLAGSDVFAAAGLDLVYAQYDHPAYPQLFGEFISHMSVIDLLFNCGPKSGDILRAGVRAVFPEASLGDRVPFDAGDKR